MSDSRKRQYTSTSRSANEEQRQTKKQKWTPSDETRTASTRSGEPHETSDNYKLVLQDAVTGRSLILEDAPDAVNRFCLKAGIALPTKDVEEVSQGNFVCKIALQPNGPLENPITGPTCATESLAEQCASFRVCRKLFARGLLDQTAFPRKATTSTQQTPSSNNESSKYSKAVHLFPKKYAFFWTHVFGVSPKRLYSAVVSITSEEASRRGTFMLLTSRPLPTLPPFAVFENGQRAVVRLRPGAPFKPNDQQLSQLYGYTLRVFRSITNKPFSMPIQTLSYLVAPLQDLPEDLDAGIGKWHFPALLDHIPWAQVSLGVEQWKIPLVSEDGLLDIDEQETIVHDRAVEFTNRLYLRKVRHDMTPRSKIEDGDEASESFLDRVKTRVRGFEGLKHDNQPMLEVDAVPAFYNHLNPHYSKQIPKSGVKFLIPELCHKFVIPARSMLLLPSIVHRIDQLLVAMELNDALFCNQYSSEQILAATSSKSAFGEHNYERLELLGDASLKLMSSTYCYLKMPETTESALHNTRQLIISNSALYYAGVQAGIPVYIQSKPFIPKIWQPDIPLPSADETVKEETRSLDSKSKRKKQKESRFTQWLAGKTVADVVEALIAVAYLAGGNEAALKAAKSLQVAMPDIEEWSDFPAQLSSVTHTSKPTIRVESIYAVEAVTGMKFKRPAILAEALTHPSSHSERMRSYEQLEFLGDAILDFLVTRYVYHAYPSLAPGGLSMLKAAMVSNTTLATISVLSGLHRHLRHSSEDLSKAFATFERQLHGLREREYTEVREENRLYKQYWLGLSPSKALSDVLEAVLAAIYVEDGFSMTGVETFFEKLLKPFYDRHIRLQSLSHHPSKTLYDLFHRLGCRQHQMSKEVTNDGVHCRVLVHGVELAVATDRSSGLVMRKAAAAALDELQRHPNFMTQICDCQTLEGGGGGKLRLSSAQLGYDM